MNDHYEYAELYELAWKYFQENKEKDKEILRLRAELSSVYNRVNFKWDSLNKSVNECMLSIKADLRNAITKAKNAE